jgi:GNAT superfamily N-acetyltransferase
MCQSFPLIQQLNPSMTRGRYLDLIREMVKPGNYFQVGCFLSGKLVGLTGIWIGTQLWCGKFIEVDNFIVDEAHRRLGIGSKLMNWVDENAKIEGCEMIRLDTYVTLEKAHRFYFFHGFRIEGFHMTKESESLLSNPALRTTNSRERLDKEIKRRTRGSVFWQCSLTRQRAWLSPPRLADTTHGQDGGDNL